MTPACPFCDSRQAETDRLREELAALKKENAALKEELVELAKLCTLQGADLDRLKAERESAAPNQPERIRPAALQLAFMEVLQTYGQVAENDEAGEGSTDGRDGDGAAADDAAADDAAADGECISSDEAAGSGTDPGEKSRAKGNKKDKKKRGGRRPFSDMTNLQVERFVIVPPEVESNPSAYRRIDDEISDRIAHRPAAYVILRIVRPKYVLIEADIAEAIEVEPPATDVAESSAVDVLDTPLAALPRRAHIVCAELPGAVWPRVMADISAITQVILSKYDMCLPLHRQERASSRCGLHVARSTQCDWVEAAYEQTYRIVDAMMAESLQAHCIATDATGAPVRVRGGTAPWHVFVFIADANHIVFRGARHHDGATIGRFLDGFSGFLLADAATIYDALYESGDVVEVSCWAHLRRYFWKARITEPALAIEALAIIAKIFEVGRHAWEIPLSERTKKRAQLVQPYLDLLDRWVDAVGPRVEARSPLASALTYYKNQHASLRTFLKDGQLRLDNNLSEQQLRHLVLGLHNWNVFETPAGLEWYCVFRSLIASCSLHGLEPQDYLNEVLRLAPHWSTRDMLALSPRYWSQTRAALSDEQKAIVVPPWLNANARREQTAA